MPQSEIYPPGQNPHDEPALLHGPIGKTGVVGDIEETRVGARLGDLSIDGEPAETGVEDQDAGRGHRVFQGERGGQDGNRTMAGMGSESGCAGQRQRAEVRSATAHVCSPAFRGPCVDCEGLAGGKHRPPPGLDT